MVCHSLSQSSEVNRARIGSSSKRPTHIHQTKASFEVALRLKRSKYAGPTPPSADKVADRADVKGMPWAVMISVETKATAK